MSVLLLAAAWFGCAGSLPPTPVPPPPVSPPGEGRVTARAAASLPSATPPPAAAFPDAPDNDPYRLALELRHLEGVDVPRVINQEPAAYAEGRRDVFWIMDLVDLRRYSGSFELRLVTPHAYWYFQEGQAVSRSALEAAAAAFEEDIYPRVTSVFGREWTPGVDNNPRLSIVNAPLRGAAGYYTSTDEYARAIYPFSNEREAVYMDSGSAGIGSSRYSRVLAHELQHAIHWNADPSEEQWVNEGLSELAVSVAGLDPGGTRRVGSRPVSLVNWPLDMQLTRDSYGLASLFMHYLLEHYGDPEDLRPLLREPRDGAAGITAYLAASGHADDFRGVFGKWAAANLLDEDLGPYGYSGLDVRASIGRRITGYSQFNSRIPQYSVEYVELRSFQEPLRLRFAGAAENLLMPVDVGPGGCWWGNAGDNINATLTAALDLRSPDRATLTYQVWFNLEKDWDYGYVEVSADGGRTWDILETPHTTAENPVGSNYGMGYTGDSGGWLDESVDLGAYAGRRVSLRFQHITDDALHGSGICVRNVAVSGAGGTSVVDGWQPNGFLRTDNRVKQEYVVQLIEMGSENRVRLVALDRTNTGEIEVAAPQELDRLVVAVAALAPKTRETASYTLTVGPARAREGAPAGR